MARTCRAGQPAAGARDELGGGEEQMLAVVQEEQASAVGRSVGDERLMIEWSAGWRKAERRGDGGRHQARVGQRRQIDPDHAIGKVLGHVLGDGQG